MTAGAVRPSHGRGGLLERLLAAVRADFRTEIYRPAPDDSVFASPTCTVVDCDRPVSMRGLCNGHAVRWRHRGQPDLAAFLADPGAPIRGRTPLAACRVDGCRYGLSSRGLCSKHHDRWARAGRPALESWEAPALVNPEATECRLPFCTLWVETPQKLFCKNDHDRWKRAGHHDVERFILDSELNGGGVIDLRDLPPQLTLEFQYGLQCRADAHRRATAPRGVMQAVRLAKSAAVSSLLDLDEAEWRQAAKARVIRDPVLFLIETRDAVETLRDGAGWEIEYCWDVWRLHKLPGSITPAAATAPRPRVRLRFDAIAQPWLRDLGKRWMRLRLTSGLSIAAARAGLDALVCFSEFLTLAGVDRLADVDRPLLERHLAWVASRPGGHAVKKTKIGGLNLFFQTIRQHRWDDTLPGTAAFYPGDTPPAPAQVSRRLAEHVMTQVESEENLRRWTNPAGRVITLVLVRCVLRISSALTLDFDCLVHDGQGAPYLRYFNTKMKREAAVPIDEELQADIRAQQQRILERWPEGTTCLFPRSHANVSGNLRLPYGTYRQMLKRWLATCEVHDEHGRPVHLTPHQWRHTFACRLINRYVPQEVVRVLLDHESSQMTAHYARITDQTVRRRWEEAMKVNIKGERVVLESDGPLGQVQWAKTRYGIATQTLPNGYCGLPVQKTCPHANACPTCPVFLTGPEFLPELREQRTRTLALIDNASGCGHTRVAEMNQQVADNLDRMISELQDGQDNPEDAAHAG
ncbi:tyrosine-type recombinase/integrase [Streptomyces cyaneofuscatus]|uniref:tyrosine-type recombinase/integrase n=1 Tax=Streptomyces cyaneofuscatus TaxID=66883 RepID=UPI002955D94B|nr:tyrosine-type recombinase/integrase [Streptomyces cyaneofuscatus]WOP07072.1 tyrosine-type recombinase/integrase [Streptomyces cyaneofuscatus]